MQKRTTIVNYKNTYNLYTHTNLWCTMLPCRHSVCPMVDCHRHRSCPL